MKTHLARILRKLGLRDRVQAVVLAYQTGLATAAERRQHECLPGAVESGTPCTPSANATGCSPSRRAPPAVVTPVDQRMELGQTGLRFELGPTSAASPSDDDRSKA